MGTTDLTKIVLNDILASFMEDNQQATGEEARQFGSICSDEVVEAFVQAVATANAHHISTAKMVELVRAITGSFNHGEIGQNKDHEETMRKIEDNIEQQMY